MNNVISKTALKTLLAVIIAAVLAFAVASLIFPQHLATAFERTGNYSFATGYASLAYKYNDTTPNLARCVDDSILAGRDAKIVKFGEWLVAVDDFDEYCASRNQAAYEQAEDGVDFSTYDYRQIVYGNLARAKYSRGDKQGAFDTAVQGMTGVAGFPINNSLAALALRVYEAKDSEYMQKLSQALQSISPADGAESEYLNDVMAILGKN